MESRTNFLLLIFLLGTVSSDLCPDPFIRLGDYCYFFSDYPLTWSEARQACQDLATTEPVDLAVFDKTCEDYIHVINHANLIGNEAWWLGGTDAQHEGDWIWIDGRSIDTAKSYWLSHEPDIDTNQNGLILWHPDTTESVPRRRIGDTNSASNFNFICQLGVQEVSF